MGAESQVKMSGVLERRGAEMFVEIPIPPGPHCADAVWSMTPMPKKGKKRDFPYLQAQLPREGGERRKE